MLSTVNVPKEFEPLFKQAEDEVRRYFKQQNAKPEKGTIEIKGSRYVLIRAAAFSVEFFQLVRRVFGKDYERDADLFAASLLYELSHSVGRSDAKNFHQKMDLADPISKLSAGPVHFSHTGWAYVDIDKESIPSPDENFCMIYRHPYSFECDSWLASEAKVEHPVCIMNAGYSSGWCQESFGIPLESRELTCRTLGHHDCLFIMAQPHLIESKIADYRQRHPELEVVDSHLAFMGEKDDFSGMGEAKDSLRVNIKHRLLAYARNLEATQAQLSDNIKRLEAEVLAKEKAQKELEESERYWRELIDASFDAIVMIQDDRVVNANRASEQLLGLPEEKVVGQHLKELLGQDEYDHLNQSIVKGEKEVTNMRLHVSDREKFVDVHVHRTHFNEKKSLILAIRDVTERARAMQRLERLANYDSLTGLPNRTRFQGIVNRSLMNADFSEKHGMLFLDLDNFKTINDSYGHSAGDLLLFEIAHRMTKIIRSGNTICRLGGDEFAVWVPNLEKNEDAAEVAKQILQALEAPILVNQKPVKSSFSIGIAVYPNDGTEYSSLTRHSDTAMYAAKRQGKNQYCFYSDALEVG